MRKSVLFTLLLAFGCQKSPPTPVAQVQPDEPNVSPSDPGRKKPPRTKRVPLAQRTDRSMIPQPPPPPPPVKAKPTLGKDEAVAAVVLFLTTKGSTTAASYNSTESQAIRPQIGGGYGDVKFTAVGEPKEYAHVAETKKIGWVVPVSFTANNTRLKCRVKATNHLFLVSRYADNERPLVIFHGESEAVAKARLGEEWYILNRPPRPATETSP